MSLPMPNMKSPSGQYVWAVVILFLIGSCLVLAVLMVRPTYDPMAIITGVMQMLVPTAAAILGYMKAQEAKAEAQEAKQQAHQANTQSKETDHNINSRVTELLVANTKASNLEGQAQGIAQEQARVAAMPPPPNPPEPLHVKAEIIIPEDSDGK